MARITLKGNQIETVGEIPADKTAAPEFTLTGTDLSEVKLEKFSGKTKVLNIFPSLDTPVCAASVRRFNEEVTKLDNTVVLSISADLPFAHNRFCETEGLKNVISCSVFRSPQFGTDYGVTVKNGPLAGLLSRAVVIVDADDKIVYSQQVPEITEEPDYDKALAALK